MWGREPLAFFHWIKLSFFPFSLYWVGQKIVHVFHKTVWQIQVNFLANPIFFLRLRRRKIRSTWYLTQQEEASQTDPSTRKILKRMIHTISYKEGLKSDLSVRCGNMEDFDFFFFSISVMIRIKTLTGVTFMGEKAGRGEQVHTSLSRVC